MGNFLNTEDRNAVDRYLTKPRALDSDLRKLKALMDASFAPAHAAINLAPVPSNVKKMLKDYPYQFTLYLVQNNRDFVRELINRVAQRSGKTTRRFGTTNLRMTAQKGDALWRTMAQLLALATTDWWATHEEALRMVAGLKQGKQIAFLGDGGVVSVPAAVTAVGAVGTVGGVTVAELVTLIGAIAALIGALTPVIVTLIDMATKDEKAAQDSVLQSAAPTMVQTASGPVPVKKRRVSTPSAPVVATPLAVRANGNGMTFAAVGAGAAVLGAWLILRKKRS